MVKHRPVPDKLSRCSWIARLAIWLIAVAVIMIFVAMTVDRLMG
jgi:hypothetical protein